MSRDSINLFKKRFLDYNRVRYADDDNWRIALESLKVDDIRVLKYMPDPESKFRTVLTEVQSDKFNLSGLDQKYTKAYFATDIISMISDKTVYPDLISVLNLNIMGVFLYQNSEEPEFPHVVVTTNFIRRWNDGLEFIKEVLTTINDYTHYEIYQHECTFSKNEEDSSGDREVIDVDIGNHTIWGNIKVAQIPAAYPLGTYPYEYLGKFNEFHLIDKESLLNLADLPDSVMDINHRPKTPMIWLKFRYYGKIFYVPKYPILTNVSWNQLNERGMCSGKTIIRAMDGNEYRLRLLCISDADNENEWDNLIKRCVADSGMTEWEAFNYKNEMQYGYKAGITYYYSGVLTEGVTADEQRYIVGGRALVNEKSPVSPTAKQTAKTIDSYTNITYAGWLPVLELRGVDPIQADTVHPHWVDLKDPVPEMNYADVEPNPDMVFAIRVNSIKSLNNGNVDIEVSYQDDVSVDIITVTNVTLLSEVPEPEISAQVFGEDSTQIITINKLSQPALDEGILNISIDVSADAFLIDNIRAGETSTVSPGYGWIPDDNETSANFVSVIRVANPKALITSPYIVESYSV